MVMAMSDHRETLLRGAMDLLENWPDDARPDRLDGMMLSVAFAEAAGLIERTTTTKPCSACGAPKPDYSFYRITPAGQVALEISRLADADLESDLKHQALDIASIT